MAPNRSASAEPGEIWAASAAALAPIGLVTCIATASPLLGLLGYVPGAAGGAGLAALAFVYALVPCALKLGALFALHRFQAASTKDSP